jgi:hypothetical protein
MDPVDLIRATLFDEPMFVFIQPNDLHRRRLLHWYVPSMLRLLERKGRLDVVPDRAAALWIPPDSRLRPPLVPRAQLLTAPFRMGFAAMQRAMEFAAAVDEVGRDQRQDAWQLIHVGVDPMHREQGHAAAALARTLAEADATGRRCFVVATSEFAVRFFVALRFDVDHHRRVVGLPQFWTMVRQPGS